MEVNRGPNRNKSNVGPAFTKYTLFLLNAIFVIASILIISSVLSTRAAFEQYYYIMMTDGLGTMTEMWLAVGFILFMVALFGIFTAFKESTTLANSYAVLMIVVFILQIIASVVSFPPINQAPDWVSYQLEIMMREYSDAYRLEIDWIQLKFQCCGINGPSDWNFFDIFYAHLDYNDNNNTNVNLLPVSCCENDSNYVNLKCERYHNTGCSDVIYQIVSAIVMLAGTFGFIFSVVQLSAILLGYYYTRILRNNKTQQYTQIWNTTDQRSSDDVTSQPPDSSTI